MIAIGKYLREDDKPPGPESRDVRGGQFVDADTEERSVLVDKLAASLFEGVVDDERESGGLVGVDGCGRIQAVQAVGG